MLPTGRAFIEVMLACWMNREAFIPLPASSGAENNILRQRSAATVRVARPVAVVGTGASLADFRELDFDTTLISDDQLADARRLPGVTAVPVPDDVAVVQFTSGSTGHPKGVVITHANMIANLASIGRRSGMNSDDTMVSWLPLFHDMGLFGGLCCPLYWDHALHLIPTESFMRNPSMWLRVLSDTRGTLSPNPTSAYDLLTRVGQERLDGIDLSAWRYAWVGAEMVYQRTIDRFVERFAPTGLAATTLRPAYGLAEATLAVTMGDPGSPLTLLSVDSEALRRSGEVVDAPAGATGTFTLVGNGRPVDHMEVQIATNDGAVVGERIQGHVLVRGAAVSRMYFGHPPRGEWLDTGDLGFLAAGELFITGREKELIIRGGANFSPSEIEWAAESAEGVMTGRVVAFGDVRPDLGQEFIVVAVETRAKSEVEETSLRARVRRAVLDHVGIKLDRIVCVPTGALPRTTSGKLRRDECRRLFARELS